MLKSANFTECGNRYMSDPELIAKYNYSGPVRLIEANQSTQITYEGCVALCGTGNDWYPWDETAATLTTWILPVLGTLLQAPFESNAFWRTIKAIGRWTGSPIVSLAYILWNIEVSGKCALFTDMAIPYDGTDPPEDSDFADIRDSFYLLINFNQYKMKPLVSMTREAEGLLRMALFSKSLKLPGTHKTLPEMRRKLAKSLRSNRRRGAVPVFISTLWFLFAVGISIESAFGLLGNNAQAHDLAMGLFVSWFPILILCSIVDRNPVASDDIQKKINKMVDYVCDALMDPILRSEFIESFIDLPESQRMAWWTEKIAEMAPIIKGNFFNGFAGQARTRFHYGIAHAILLDIEKSYIANHGRGWFSRDPRGARAALVLGQVDGGFVWFDGRQLWQITSAIMFVFGTSIGAFIISYFTPTVGLGCRTGGYVIYIVITLFLLLAELFIWYFTSPVRNNSINDLIRQQMGSYEPEMVNEPVKIKFPGVATSRKTLAWLLKVTEGFIVSAGVSLTYLLPYRKRYRFTERTEAAIKHHFKTLHGLTARQWAERCILTPVEIVNMAWLVYMLFAQTTGAFVNCMCQTSNWAYGGGYLDFTQWDQSNNDAVGQYWVSGTIISSLFMGVGMIYIVLEWCIQAHLSTENYKDAMSGLWKVRRFRRITYWIRYPASVIVAIVNNLASTLRLRKTSARKTLIWSYKTKNKEPVGRSIIKEILPLHSLPSQAGASTVDSSRSDIRSNGSKSDTALDEKKVENV